MLPKPIIIMINIESLHTTKFTIFNCKRGNLDKNELCYKINFFSYLSIEVNLKTFELKYPSMETIHANMHQNGGLISLN